MIVEIEKLDILKVIEKFARYPQSTVCKHLLMLDLLELLEEKTSFVDMNLIQSVSSSDDEKILLRLEALKR